MALYRDAGLPEAERAPYPKPAADLIADLVHQSPRKVTILGLGPNTNIALAFARDPSIIANVEQVVLSADAFNVPGNVGDGSPPETFLETRRATAPWSRRRVRNRSPNTTCCSTLRRPRPSSNPGQESFSRRSTHLRWRR